MYTCTLTEIIAFKLIYFIIIGITKEGIKDYKIIQGEAK